MPANHSQDLKRLHYELISLEERFDAKFALLDQIATTLSTIQSHIGVIQQGLDRQGANVEPAIGKRKRGRPRKSPA